MKELLEYLAKCLVDAPDEVSVALTEEESVVVLELCVAPDDVGRVIGRRGRVVHALRTVMNACAMKHGKRVVLEIID